MTCLRRPVPVLALICALTLSTPLFAAASGPSFSFGLPSPSGSYLAGQEAFSELNTGQAAQYLLDATEQEWSNPAVIERAFAALAADGRIEDSATLAKHMLDLVPNYDLAKLVTATVALRERRYQSVISELDNIGFDNFIGITAGVVKAWAHVGLGDLDAAYADLDAMGGGGLESFLVFHRALMAEVAGDDGKAVQFAAQAYNNDPTIGRVVEAYARILAANGQDDRALEVIADYDAQGLDHPAVDLVRQQIENGRTPGKFAGNVPSGAAELFNTIGAALARDSASDVSLIFLQLGKYLEPDSAVISLTIGQLLDQAGQHDQANTFYLAVPDKSPYKSEATVRMAENLDTMGDHDEAIRRLGNIVAVDPKNLDAISSLGDMLRFDGQYAKAAETYTKALDATGGDRPADWRFYYVRGIAFEQSGEWPSAEADFKKALALNPDQPQVLNYLGYSWVDKGEHLQDAMRMIQKAVTAAPGDGYIVDSLGWAYFKMGRISEAVDTLEKAAQLLPNDPEVNDHLGDAYWRAGRKREARFQWNIAADVDTKGDVADRVKPKLENGLPAASV